MGADCRCLFKSKPTSSLFRIQKFNLDDPDGCHSYSRDLRAFSVDYQDVLGHRLVSYLQRFAIVNFTFQKVPQSTSVEAPRPGWSTMTWTLWTGHRALRT
uniref:DUF667 domain-containing protein n=1 Tax=Heterorhabditis bacteriophora TaxID=37862 RepID=A0A1I7WQD6_HETBA